MTTSREIEVTIVHYVKKQGIEKDHLLDVNDYLLPQISRICSRYDILEEEAKKYTLQVEQQDEEPFVLSNDVISKQVKLREGDKLQLVVKPEVRVANIMDILDRETLSESIKKDVFLLKKELLDDVVFAETFIRHNGVQVLAKVVNKTYGNIQAYALGCLKSALSYVSGMNVINDSPEIASDVYSLIDHEGMESSSKQTTIYRNALEILIVFCNYLDNGFTFVHHAAKKVARSRDPPSEPYSNLLYLLDSGDIDVLVDTVTLMNLMLSKAPSKYKQKRLLHRWRQLDIPSKLAESPINDRNWRTQLDVFQTSTGIVIPKSWYEVDILKKQNSEISRENDELKRQLFFYHQQEPYITTLKSELRRCYDEFKNAVGQGVEGISYRAHPFGRHGTEETGDIEIPNVGKEQNTKDQQRSNQNKDSVVMKDQEVQTSILMCEIMGMDDDEYDDEYDEYYADEEGQVPGSVEEDDTVLIRKSELEELQKIAEQLKQGKAPNTPTDTSNKTENNEGKEKEQNNNKNEENEEEDEESDDMDGMEWQMDLLTQASAQLDRLQEQIGAKEERVAILNQQIEQLQKQLNSYEDKQPASTSSEGSEGTSGEIKEKEETKEQENKKKEKESETREVTNITSEENEKSDETEKKEEVQEKESTEETIEVDKKESKDEQETEKQVQTEPKETQKEGEGEEQETQTPKENETTTREQKTEETQTQKEGPQSKEPETASSNAMPTESTEENQIQSKSTSESKDTSDLTVDVASPISVSALLEGDTQSPSTSGKIKMKTLNWEKLPVNKNSSTIWGQIQPEKAKFDTEQIRVLFSRREGWEAYIDLEGDDSESRKDIQRPQKSDTLLDSKRWNTLSIALHRLPPVEEVRRAVYQMDSRKLSLEQIEHILRASPSEDELQHFKETLEKKGDDVKLQKPEEFVKMITEVPEFTARLRCWRFRIIIDDMVNNVRKPMMNVIEASKQVKNSEAFKILLQYVLSIGNFMNGETATAFNVENLNQLDSLKDRTNRVSLLQYLCDVLYKAHPEVTSLPADLDKAHTAGKQGLHIAENAIRSLNAEFKRFKKNIKKVRQISKSGDLFMEELTQFEKRADESTVATNTELHRATREFHQMLRYLGVPPSRIKEIKSEEFFESLANFLASFKRYMDDPRRISPWRLQGKRIGKSGASDAMSSIVQSIKKEMANKNQQ